jgi:hypothetical protein
MSELDLAGKLGFKDFVAFILPGFTMLFGLALLSNGVSPRSMAQLPKDTALQIWLAVATVALSWILGIASAEALRGAERKRVKRLAATKNLLGPADEAFRAACTLYWNRELPVDSENVYESFYVCRALVREVLPIAKAKMERAGSLRQAAKNSALPVLILGIGAATWAYSITDPVLRVTLLSAVVVVTPLAFHALVVGAAKARLREIREAFWSVAALPAVQKLVPLKASKDAG